MSDEKTLVMIVSFDDAAKSLNTHNSDINNSMCRNTLCAGYNWRYL